MQRKLEVRGTRDQRPAQPAIDGAVSGTFKATVKETVRLDSSRGDESPVEFLNVADDDIIEIELNDGQGTVRRWIRASDLEDEIPAVRKLSRGAGDVVVAIPGSIPRSGQQRGAGEWLLKALRVIDVDLAHASAKEIANRLEQKAVPNPGVYHWPPTGERALLDQPIAAGGKLLLFLHGTGSNTKGSFGALQDQGKYWDALCKEYGDRIFALEHKTLSESPIQNAILALQKLPQDATVHLVSHSRGGLVGELLCRASLDRGPNAATNEPFTPDEIDLLTDPGQRQQLAALAKLLKAKRPKIERYVRVACPARGTILASERLDRYLTVLLNVVGFFLPPGGTSEIYDFLKAFLLAVVQERTRPESIPGIEAMMPSSPFQKLINRRGVIADADLSVIKGDLEGRGLFDLATLKAFATDLFYREDHDLVVNTAAMDGGLQRKIPGRAFFDQGPIVNHFSYFRNARTADQLLKMLRGEYSNVEQIEVRSAAMIMGVPAVGRGAPRAAVFVVPEFGGTLLNAQKKPVWLDIGALAAGGMGSLAIDSPNVEPTGLLELYYGPLTKELSASHDVIPFPYDWRLSFATEGARFANVLEQKLAETTEAVRIVAHGMGGFLVRSAFAQSPQLWPRIRDNKGSRVVFLGTPHGGTYAVPLMLMGRDQTGQMLGALDFNTKPNVLLALLAGFPSLLETLPRDGHFDLFSVAGWQSLQADDLLPTQWQPPHEPALAAAFEVRKQIDAVPFDRERMLYVAGLHESTVDGIRIESSAPSPDAPAETRVVFIRTVEGDGRVPWNSGIPAEVRAWYCNAAHGDLVRDRIAIRAVAELVRDGRTDLVPGSRPAVRSIELRPLRYEMMEVFPGADDLAAAAIGGRFAPPVVERIEPVQIKVVHGNLAFAHYPLLVGHYRGDAIDGAEAHVDRLLDGRLKKRRVFGLYPDEINTTELMMDATDDTRGAIVVGLGDAGRLTVGDLRRTLTRGLLRYSVYWLERQRHAPATTGNRIQISTLLVGSGEGGLPLGQCVAALLEALRIAQRTLAGHGSFGQVEIVELYEDRAIHILKLAKRFQHDKGRDQILCDDEVSGGEGGRKRVSFDAGRNWFQPINITMDDNAMDQRGYGEPLMRFVVPTDMARAEAAVLPAHREFVDGFIKEAIAGGDGGASGGSAGRALFEMLIPEALKERMRDDRPLRLILDKKTADYPWELMDDRRSWEDEGGTNPAATRKPPSVRFGMVRQLVSQSFRQRVVRSAGTKILVIGDPRGDAAGGAASKYPELPGAQREATAVAEMLSGLPGCHVTQMVGEDARAGNVVKQLCERDWKVIHIAAHGVLAGDNSKSTGVVLASGMILTADMLRQQLPVTPDLVFVNCCHLGQIQPDSATVMPHRFAASIATELIEMGVTAVVAAGWAVDDHAASRFAEVFYTQMIDGQSFADAVQAARETIYNDFPGLTTWGAYQCYGEPDWKLNDIGWTGENHQTNYASVVEFISDIEQVSQDAQTGMARSKDAQLKKLNTLVDQAEKNKGRWLKRPDVLTSLGSAYGELNDLKKACDYYSKAIASERGVTPLRSIEQLANLTVRAAVIGRVPKTNYKKLGKTALDQLKALAKLAGDTVERFSMRGGCHKRLAQVSKGDKRKKQLAAMAVWYAKADERARANGAPDPYPLLMCVTARVAAEIRESDNKTVLTKKFEQMIAEAEQKAKDDDEATPNFWSAVAQADALLLRYLAGRDLSETKRKEVEEAYLKRWKRGGSWLKFQSVLEQIQFFIDVWDDGDKRTATTRQELRDALYLLSDALKVRTGEPQDP